MKIGLFCRPRGEDRAQRETQRVAAGPSQQDNPICCSCFPAHRPILVPASALLENVLSSPAVWHLSSQKIIFFEHLTSQLLVHEIKWQMVRFVETSSGLCIL